MDIQIVEGGPNIFADLGLLLVKAKLTYQISRVIKDRNLNQSDAAALIGLPQPKLSNILRGKFHGVSEDKLMRCLAALGHDVTIVVSSKEKAEGRVEVEYA